MFKKAWSVIKSIVDLAVGIIVRVKKDDKIVVDKEILDNVVDDTKETIDEIKDITKKEDEKEETPKEETTPVEPESDPKPEEPEPLEELITPPFVEDKPEVKLTSIDLSKEEVFKMLKEAGFTDAGAAGLMGNLQAESGIRSNNLQNTYEKRFKCTDEEYTEAIDSGKYEKEIFIKDRAGYGIAQWTYWSRKQGLYEYAQSIGHSIGSCKMQVEYLIKELNSDFRKVTEVLKTTDSVIEASDIVLEKFEAPAVLNYDERRAMSQTFYDQFAGKF